MATPEKPSNGASVTSAFGTSALVTGILGAALGIVTPAFLFVIPLGLGLLAVMFATIAIYRTVKRGAGSKVVGISGLIVGVLALVLGTVGVVRVNSAVDALNNIGSSAAPPPAPPVPQAPPFTPTVPSGSVTDPASVVTSYFAAINARDYARAYRLGGVNLDPSYAHFVAGFSDTSADSWTTLSISDERVTGRLEAIHTDGSVTYYSGYYLVSGDAITGAHLQ